MTLLSITVGFSQQLLALKQRMGFSPIHCAAKAPLKIAGSQIHQLKLTVINTLNPAFGVTRKKPINSL
jgi:hypothetical protein